LRKSAGIVVLFRAFVIEEGATKSQMNNFYVAVGDALIVKYSAAVFRRLLYHSL